MTKGSGRDGCDWRVRGRKWGIKIYGSGRRRVREGLNRKGEEMKGGDGDKKWRSCDEQAERGVER